MYCVHTYLCRLKEAGVYTEYIDKLADDGAWGKETGGGKNRELRYSKLGYVVVTYRAI